MTELNWNLDLLMWFIRPSVIPWVGVLAAIIAALTIDLKTWLKGPVKFIGRALRVATLWVVIAWLIGVVAQFISGPGNDTGGGNPGTIIKDGITLGPIITVPPGTPANGNIRVIFIPSPGNQGVAQNFSCDLLSLIGTDMTKTEIRAKNMPEFYKLVVETLRKVGGDEAPTPLEVRIKRSPFPGESVIKGVEGITRVALPKAVVVIEE